MTRGWGDGENLKLEILQCAGRLKAIDIASIVKLKSDPLLTLRSFFSLPRFSLPCIVNKKSWLLDAVLRKEPKISFGHKQEVYYDHY